MAMATNVTSGSAEALDNKIHWHQTNLGHLGPKRRETLINSQAVGGSLTVGPAA